MDETAPQQDTFASREASLFRPISESDLLEIRKQLRGQAIERHVLAFEKYASHLGEERVKAMEHSKDYGQIFVRTIFLLNGGAILALLTFIGSMYGKSDLNVLVAISLGKKLVPAFYCFAGGLVSAALVAAIAYFNWMIVTESYPGAGAFLIFCITNRLKNTQTSKGLLTGASLWRSRSQFYLS
jgi:hypothetical protein